MYPLFLPHFQQRRTSREENLGFLTDLAIVDFFAIKIGNAFIKNQMISFVLTESPEA